MRRCTRALCPDPHCTTWPQTARAAVILALRDIEAGEEVTLSYIGARAPLPARRHSRLPRLRPPGSLPAVQGAPARSPALHPPCTHRRPRPSAPAPPPASDEEAPLAERREQLADYGFACACDKCAAEELAEELGGLCGPEPTP